MAGGNTPGGNDGEESKVLSFMDKFNASQKNVLDRVKNKSTANRIEKPASVSPEKVLNTFQQREYIQPEPQAALVRNEESSMPTFFIERMRQKAKQILADSLENLSLEGLLQEFRFTEVVANSELRGKVQAEPVVQDALRRLWTEIMDRLQKEYETAANFFEADTLWDFKRQLLQAYNKYEEFLRAPKLTQEAAHFTEELLYEYHVEDWEQITVCFSEINKRVPVSGADEMSEKNAVETYILFRDCLGRLRERKMEMTRYLLETFIARLWGKWAKAFSYYLRLENLSVQKVSEMNRAAAEKVYHKLRNDIPFGALAGNRLIKLYGQEKTLLEHNDSLIEALEARFDHLNAQSLELAFTNPDVQNMVIPEEKPRTLILKEAQDAKIVPISKNTIVPEVTTKPLAELKVINPDDAELKNKKKAKEPRDSFIPDLAEKNPVLPAQIPTTLSGLPSLQGDANSHADLNDPNDLAYLRRHKFDLYTDKEAIVYEYLPRGTFAMLYGPQKGEWTQHWTNVQPVNLLRPGLALHGNNNDWHEAVITKKEVIPNRPRIEILKNPFLDEFPLSQEAVKILVHAENKPEGAYTLLVPVVGPGEHKVRIMGTDVRGHRVDISTTLDGTIRQGEAFPTTLTNLQGIVTELTFDPKKKVYVVEVCGRRNEEDTYQRYTLESLASPEAEMAKQTHFDSALFGAMFHHYETADLAFIHEHALGEHFHVLRNFDAQKWLFTPHFFHKVEFEETVDGQEVKREVFVERTSAIVLDALGKATLYFFERDPDEAWRLLDKESGSSIQVNKSMDTLLQQLPDNDTALPKMDELFDTRTNKNNASRDEVLYSLEKVSVNFDNAKLQNMKESLTNPAGVFNALARMERRAQQLEKKRRLEKAITPTIEQNPFLMIPSVKLLEDLSNNPFRKFWHPSEPHEERGAEEEKQFQERKQNFQKFVIDTWYEKFLQYINPSEKHKQMLSSEQKQTLESVWRVYQESIGNSAMTNLSKLYYIIKALQTTNTPLPRLQLDAEQEGKALSAWRQITEAVFKEDIYDMMQKGLPDIATAERVQNELSLQDLRDISLKGYKYYQSKPTAPKKRKSYTDESLVLQNPEGETFVISTRKNSEDAHGAQPPKFLGIHAMPRPGAQLTLINEEGQGKRIAHIPPQFLKYIQMETLPLFNNNYPRHLDNFMQGNPNGSLKPLHSNELFQNLYLLALGLPQR